MITLTVPNRESDFSERTYPTNLLDATKIARHVEKLSQKFFPIVLFKNCPAHVRMFLVKVVLRAQMRWVFKRGGFVTASIQSTDCVGKTDFTTFACWEDTDCEHAIDQIFELLRKYHRTCCYWELLEILEDDGSWSTTFALTSSDDLTSDSSHSIPLWWL